MTNDAAPARGSPSPGELAFYQACRVVAVGASLAAFPGRVIRADRLPSSGPYILAPVHRSYLDWLLVARLTRRRLRYVVKAEVWRSKAAGRLVEALGGFPVNRSGADREALERCRRVLQGGEPLVMFPEGTRRSGSEVGQLREGVAYLALSSGVPIYPVGIAGAERAMPRGSIAPRPRRVDLVVGEPVVAREREAGEGRRARVSRRAMHEVTEELRRAMERAQSEAETVLASTTMRGKPQVPRP